MLRQLADLLLGAELAAQVYRPRPAAEEWAIYRNRRYYRRCRTDPEREGTAGTRLQGASDGSESIHHEPGVRILHLVRPRKAILERAAEYESAWHLLRPP
jgi:hypothetical protein